jgi:two-component system, OmpR family, KDP operon response regulator KdpE
MSGNRVLVVDDEPKLARTVKTILAANGFEQILAATGEEGLDLLDREQSDLVLLDLFLPGIDGLAVCRAIRLDRQLDVPIIILSAEGAEDSKVEALDLGADDYLTRPFGARELLARMRAALRRSGKPSLAGQAVLEHGSIRMELERREVSIGGRPVHLTPKEYQMLQYLLVNAGKLVTHGALLRHVWGPEYADASPYLHVFVRQLRQKIESDPHRPQYIVTRPGVGYQLADVIDPIGA